MSHPFGIDVSRWQSVISWDAVAKHVPKVEFAGIRATISWGYVDPFFKSNYAESKKHRIPRAAYHVIYPKESHLRQMNNFIEAMDGDWGELNPILDIELHHGETPLQYRETILNSLIYLYEQTGRIGIIYSRASFMDSYVTGTRLNSSAKPPDWYNYYDWWLAHYLSSGAEHPGPPALPLGVPRNKVIIHQTTDKGIPIGMPDCNTLDYNRWQPGAVPLSEYINKPIDPIDKYMTVLNKINTNMVGLKTQMTKLANNDTKINDKFIR